MNASRLLFWLFAAVAAAAEALVLRATFAAPRADAGSGRAAAAARRSPRALEAAWALLPAVVLVVLFVAAWRDV